jgi:tRNA(fMet)-specific endonuclease VapC
LEKLGQPIGSLDTMIAAQALALDLPLITNNQKEFLRVPGLRLENWV